MKSSISKRKKKPFKGRSLRQNSSTSKKASRKKSPLRVVKKRPDHYMRLTFGKFWNGHSEMVFFIKTQLPLVFKAFKEKQVGLEIARLEPLDQSYTHVKMTSPEIRKRMVHFSLKHGLHRSHNHLVAIIPVKKMLDVLRDYDILFDIFFTDISFHTKKIKIELMDPFFGAFLVKADIKTLSLFEKLVKKHTYLPVKFEIVDHV